MYSVHIMYIMKNLRDFSSGNFNYIKLSYHEQILEPMYVHIKDEPVNFYSFKQKKPTKDYNINSTFNTHKKKKAGQRRNANLASGVASSRYQSSFWSVVHTNK